VAFHVQVSSWLFTTVFIVALFLAAGKRLGELLSLGEDAQRHRSILSSYSPTYLEGLLWFCASVSVTTFALYLVEKKSELIYSLPIAAYGLLRYIHNVKNGMGDPTDVLVRDIHVLITGALWVALIGSILYR
jgi:decaprenyl-phosphate phosphoribosyltransferase